eukprot:9049116-Pyramimonas_sp.AAC.1
MRCGAYTSGLPRKIGEPCSAIFKRQRSHILNGKCPWPRGLRLTRPWPLARPEEDPGGEWRGKMRYL